MAGTLDKILGGSQVAPIITAPAFPADYIPEIGEPYWYDPLNKRLIPEYLACSQASFKAAQSTGYIYTGARESMFACTTDDGVSWVFALMNNTFASSAQRTVVPFKRDRLDEKSQTLREVAGATTVNFSANISPTNQALCNGKRMVGTDTWFFVAGSYLTSVSGIDVRLIKAVYDSGTQTWAISSSANFINTDTSTSLWELDVVTDPTDNSIFIFNSNATGADIGYERYDATTMSRSHTGTVLNVKTNNPLKYPTAFNFGNGCRLSNGKYMFLGYNAANAGGIFDWNGSAFVATGTNNLSQYQSQIIQTDDPDVFLQYAVFTQGAQSFVMAKYDPVGNTLDVLNSEINVDKFASLYEGTNKDGLMGYAGNNKFIFITGTTNSRLAILTFDPDTYETIGLETYNHGVDENSEYLTWDEKFIGHSGGVVGGSDDVDKSNTVALGTFSLGALMREFNPVPAGFVESVTAGDPNILITTGVAKSSETLVANTLYGGFASLDSEYLLPIDLRGGSAFTKCLTSGLIADSSTNLPAFNATFPVNMLGSRIGTEGQSPAQATVNGRSVTGKAWPISNTATAQDVVSFGFADGYMSNVKWNNVTNGSTSRHQVIITGAQKATFAAGNGSSSVKLDGILEVTR